jgi:hypothetical protein
LNAETGANCYLVGLGGHLGWCARRRYRMQVA